MNIVRVKIDHVWLNKNLPILEKFWKDVEYYRQNDIKCHPKYKPPKKILDLRDNSDDNDDVCLPKEILIRDV
jgi:hypothetical protein